MVKTYDELNCYSGAALVVGVILNVVCVANAWYFLHFHALLYTESLAAGTDSRWKKVVQGYLFFLLLDASAWNC